MGWETMENVECGVESEWSAEYEVCQVWRVQCGEDCEILNFRAESVECGAVGSSPKRRVATSPNIAPAAQRHERRRQQGTSRSRQCRKRKLQTQKLLEPEKTTFQAHCKSILKMTRACHFRCHSYRQCEPQKKKNATPQVPSAARATKNWAWTCTKRCDAPAM